MDLIALADVHEYNCRAYFSQELCIVLCRNQLNYFLR